MDNYFGYGLLFGIMIGVVIATGIWIRVIDLDNINLKAKYIKCNIANYNTTSGAFEFKPQYKILGE